MECPFFHTKEELESFSSDWKNYKKKKETKERPKKSKLTHFLSFPMNTQEVKSSILNLKDSIIQEYG